MLRKLVLDKTDQNGRLAHPGVADYHRFVEMVELFYHIFRINNYKSIHGYSCAPSCWVPSIAFLASSCSAKIFSSAKNFLINASSLSIRFLSVFSLALSSLLSVIAFLRVLSTSLAQACSFTMVNFAA